jgi:hypothetical protein
MEIRASLGWSRTLKKPRGQGLSLLRKNPTALLAILRLASRGLKSDAVHSVGEPMMRVGRLYSGMIFPTSRSTV